ncbi:MAG: PEP-CTERM sorting domain-containing protein [Pirellula sp.]|jgi:hypothetical protein
MARMLFALAYGALAFFWCGSYATIGHASVLMSDTVNQAGIKIDGPGVRVVKLGTFTFDQGYTMYTQVQLRAWVDLAGTSVTANSPNSINSPTLMLAKHSPTHDVLGSSPILTDLQITNFTTPTFGVDEQTTSWVSLDSTQGAQLASIINNDPLGRVDAYLISTVHLDFHAPSSATFFTFLGRGRFQVNTITYTSTLSLVAVPEPASILAMGGMAILGGISALSRRRMRR